MIFQKFSLTKSRDGNCHLSRPEVRMGVKNWSTPSNSVKESSQHGARGIDILPLSVRMEYTNNSINLFDYVYFIIRVTGRVTSCVKPTIIDNNTRESYLVGEG